MSIPVAISRGLEPVPVSTDLPKRTLNGWLDGKPFTVHEPFPFTVKDGCVDAELLRAYVRQDPAA